MWVRGSPGCQARFLHAGVGKASGSSTDKISHVQDGTTVCRPGPRSSGEICTACAAVCLVRSDLVFPSPMVLASDVQTIIGTRRSCCQIFSLVTSSASWCIIIRLLTSRLTAIGLHLNNGLGKWLQALHRGFLHLCRLPRSWADDTVDETPKRYGADDWEEINGDTDNHLQRF